MKKVTLAALLLLSMLAPLPAWAAGAEPGGEIVASGLSAPVGMAHDAQGRLWVAEWGANRIVRLDDRGRRAEIIEGLAQPAGLAFDADGTLWAAGYGDGRIYAWTPETGLSVVASGLSAPTGLFWSLETGLLAANRNAGELVRIQPDGTREVVSSGHRLPVDVTRLADGSLAVSCYGGSVDMVAPDGAVRSLPAAAAGLVRPGVGILAAGADSVLVADNGAGSVARLDKGGRAAVLVTGLASPVGLARAPDGRILVAPWGDGTVRAFPREGF
ncbi:MULTISPECIES: hypothetical protein [unclassified Desulfovibrio]|uniref:Vgb family protein n=1 Tax=unclassified Desulfovibrio TaxID=2593640 RepID=UPI0013EAED52|nr:MULTISPECIES: hypothetical protein [unclassified Desulfovibrio]